MYALSKRKSIFWFYLKNNSKSFEPFSACYFILQKWSFSAYLRTFMCFLLCLNNIIIFSVFFSSFKGLFTCGFKIAPLILISFRRYPDQWVCYSYRFFIMKSLLLTLFNWVNLFFIYACIFTLSVCFIFRLTIFGT